MVTLLHGRRKGSYLIGRRIWMGTYPSIPLIVPFCRRHLDSTTPVDFVGTTVTVNTGQVSIAVEPDSVIVYVYTRLLKVGPKLLRIYVMLMPTDPTGVVYEPLFLAN